MNALYTSKEFSLLTISFFYLFPEMLLDRFLGMNLLWPLAVIQYFAELFLTVFMPGHINFATSGENIERRVS